MRRYTVVLSPDPTLGGFSVSCPAAPGAFSQGETREIALANIAEALQLWIEVELERGRSTLDETPSLISQEIATILQDRDELGWDRSIETAVVDLPAAIPV